LMSQKRTTQYEAWENIQGD